MASHTDLPYAIISEKDAVNKALDFTGHYSGHVNILVSLRGTKCFLMGDRRKCEFVSTFGGVANGDETLLETIKRKTEIQSLGCIMTSEELEYRLRKAGKIVMHEYSHGRDFTAFVYMGPDEFPFHIASDCFVQKSKLETALTWEQQENVDLDAVSLEMLKRDDHGEMRVVETESTIGQVMYVDENAMPAFRHAFPFISSWWSW